jgi:hypothetical protein
LSEEHVVSVATLYRLLPAVVLCTLFLSSTLFSESISLSKYPGYGAYQQRVAMFIPLATPVLGILLTVKGKRAEVDAIVYGQRQ